MSQRDVGVPGALAAALRTLGDRIPPERLDRIWIFPPLARGRTESGLVAASCLGDEDRRTLVTVAYRAEETGKGVTFVPSFQEEGEAPEDRLPRVMAGVALRSEDARGAPRMVPIDGRADAFEALIEEVGPTPAVGPSTPERRHPS